MSSAPLQIAPVPEHVCYVHCNFCNTILAVSVPSHSMLNIVTVRCGHCTSLLSVNLRGLIQSLPVQNHHYSQQQENFTVQNMGFTENYPEYAPSYRMPTTLSAKGDLDHMLHVRGSNDCGFFVMSYMKSYDHNAGVISSFNQLDNSRDLRAHALHQLTFHRINKVLPLPLDIQRFMFARN